MAIKDTFKVQDDEEIFREFLKKQLIIRDWFEILVENNYFTILLLVNLTFIIINIPNAPKIKIDINF